MEKIINYTFPPLALDADCKHYKLTVNKPGEQQPLIKSECIFINALNRLYRELFTKDELERKTSNSLNDTILGVLRKNFKEF